jgi:N-methylhydantoinase B/oxoprolinase/acetone carboxylase alpha subunit
MRADAAGAGQWRGGTGAEYDVELKSPAEYSFRGEGMGRPTGLGVEGGTAGKVACIAVTEGAGEPRTPPPYALWRLGPSRLTVSSPGGGGYGDPIDRDPAAVLRDVRDDVVTQREAEEVYGVVFADGAHSIGGEPRPGEPGSASRGAGSASVDPGTPVIDTEATRARRHKMRAERHAATAAATASPSS